MADEITTPELNDPVVQKGALVGDEAVQGAAQDVDVEVNTDPVPAQVAGTPGDASEEVAVHETHIVLDHVVTDPRSPEAVQIPDAGRGSLDLPIHALGGPTVEDVFSEHASSIEERADDEPAPGDASAPNRAAHDE